MGYTTAFQGVLRFTAPLISEQRQALDALFLEDRRDHPEWDAPDTFNYVDLCLADHGKGIQWDETTEKTYGMVDIVNTVLRLLRSTWPEFGLTGRLLAQGDESNDRWYVVMGADGWAHRVSVASPAEQETTCPQCRQCVDLDYLRRVHRAARAISATLDEHDGDPDAVNTEVWKDFWGLVDQKPPTES